MGATAIEKIIRRNTGKTEVKSGDIVIVNVDRMMIHDTFIPFVADKSEEVGSTRLWDADKMVLVYDHLVPASQVDDTGHFQVGDAFAKKHGLTHVHRSDGICHQLMTEVGYVKPGDVAFGIDSHTTIYGCVGVFSSGIGYTEMANTLGTGITWVRVPETIKVVIDGKLPDYVISKDIILWLIGDLGMDGVTYRVLEFSGSAVEAMSMPSWMIIANMAVETGTKCVLFMPDEKTAEYCQVELMEEMRDVKGNEDMAYCRTITYRAEDFVPVLACPSQVDNIKPVNQLEGTPTDQVFIGPCTSRRPKGLVMAAGILKGRNVAPHVKLIMTLASRKIYLEAAKLGVIDILIAAGAIVTHPGCGLCYGRTGGISSDGERVVATNNRNFLGWIGTSKVEIFLASLATAAASAIAGRIVVAV